MWSLTSRSIPGKDKRVSGAFYGVTVSPADGSIWGSALGFPGFIARVSPGSNPAETALTEVYELPWGNPKAAVQGFSPRGLDIDTQRRGLDGYRQRALRELRPAQMQGTAQRA